MATETRDATVAGDASFAFDLYSALSSVRAANLFFSPYSIAAALTMTFVGARSQTATEMESVLHVPVSGDALHATRKQLDSELKRSGDDSDSEGDLQLRIANSLWGQRGLHFEPQFLATLDRHYDAGMQQADFRNAPEEARQAINVWVEEHTEHKIEDLIRPGVITTLTRLVLANAVYFKAQWSRQFDAAFTKPAPFYVDDDITHEVPMMRMSGRYTYLGGDDYQAVRLPYRGQASMLVIAPKRGRFQAVQRQLSPEFVDEVAAHLVTHQVDLGVPRFELTSSFLLSDMLRSLGMPTAFDQMSADFSGITLDERLHISEAVHKAFVSVDEQGTEAAAATAVVMDTTAFVQMPSAELTLDRPFIFAIQCDRTGALLFLGHLLHPHAKQ